VFYQNGNQSNAGQNLVGGCHIHCGVNIRSCQKSGVRRQKVKTVTWVTAQGKDQEQQTELWASDKLPEVKSQRQMD
jgi:hypothetical protein